MSGLRILIESAATPADLAAPRTQMALSLGWHIVIACFGAGMPAITVFAEWRFLRTGEEAYRLLAHRLEAGWITTEVGRQPWIVWGHLRVADAVTPVPGLVTGLTLVAVVYLALTVAPLAPQEPAQEVVP
jgi:cytochrome bd-type quinol oxidase subunit 1